MEPRRGRRNTGLFRELSVLGGWGLEADITVELQARDLGKAKLSL